eukprot:1050195-Amphidinium_carterae.2
MSCAVRSIDHQLFLSCRSEVARLGRLVSPSCYSFLLESTRQAQILRIGTNGLLLNNNLVEEAWTALSPVPIPIFPCS